MARRKTTDMLFPLLARMYEQIILLDKNIGGGTIINEGINSGISDYNEWCRQMYYDCYEGDDSVLFLQKISAEAVTAALAYEDEYVVDFSVKEEDGEVYRKQLKAFPYADAGMVCIGICDVTQQYMREQARERVAKVCLDVAQEATIDKERFWQRMSDEIRLPVSQALEMLEKALAQDGPEVKEYVRKAKSVLENYSGMCEEILTISALEKGEKFDRDDLIFTAEMAEDIKIIASVENHGNGCEVILGSSTSKIPGFLTDKRRLRQMIFSAMTAMMNLPADGVVSVVIDFDMNKECNMQENVVDLVFSVTVKGVSEAFLRNSRMLHAERLADYLDGTAKITANDDAEFSIRIPVQRADKERQKEARRVAHMSDSIIARNFTGFRALVIDDDAVACEIIAAKLQHYGLAVETAEDGQEAKDMLLASPVRYYQIIFTKMFLPKKSGLELTKELREEKRRDLNDITVVALTGNPLRDKRIRALEHGMDYHLVLPFNDIELKEVLLRELKDLGPEDLPEKFGFRVLK